MEGTPTAPQKDTQDNMSQALSTPKQATAMRALNEASERFTQAQTRFEASLGDLFLAYGAHFPKVPFYNQGLTREAVRKVVTRLEAEYGSDYQPTASSDEADKALSTALKHGEALVHARQAARETTDQHADVFLEPLRKQGQRTREVEEQRDEAMAARRKALYDLLDSWPDFPRREFARESGMYYRSLVADIKGHTPAKKGKGAEAREAWDAALKATSDYTLIRQRHLDAIDQRYQAIKLARVATAGLVSVRRLAEITNVQYAWFRLRLAHDNLADLASAYAEAKRLLREAGK